ncbi:pr domain zinc finger protein [Anaeramoeba flamelloides]|uniref:Pr domain zinc finger protein n=1 Tax=Anaeramoeba flamelloides TaxID=1746091 RepID=A0AAV7ZEH4_9EUKA|nr:pr domain zinc finger protein [Anaeramoeba flamelloides]
MFQIHYNCLQCGKLFRTKNSLDKHISVYHKFFYKTLKRDKRKRNKVKKNQEQINKKEIEKDPLDDEEIGTGTEFTKEGVRDNSYDLHNEIFMNDKHIFNNERNIEIDTQNNLKNEQQPPNFERFINEFDEIWIEFYILYLESKISSSQADKLLHFIDRYFTPKGGEKLPKTMRTLKKKINSFINIQKPKEIDLIPKKYIEKKGNIILLQEKIETKYFSPITWINLVLHSEIIKHLSIKKNEEIENLVTNEGFIPSRFSSFPAFDQKIKKIPKINAEHLFLIGFYYDEFKCTESFSLGGLYMFIDNLEYSWRLKDQTIFFNFTFARKNLYQ